MTDDELQRRINRDHDYRTLKERVILAMIVLFGVGMLVAYVITTRGVNDVSSGEVRE